VDRGSSVITPRAFFMLVLPASRTTIRAGVTATIRYRFQAQEHEDAGQGGHPVAGRLRAEDRLHRLAGLQVGSRGCGHRIPESHQNLLCAVAHD
jgi:hypothetical protein